MTEETQPAIEIRDPRLDGEAIAQQVLQHVAQRRTEGAYGPDPAKLGPESLRPSRYKVADGMVSENFSGLHQSLAEFILRGQLHEPNFSSNTPIVGPLIVAVRRFWNWMSTKWYVRPILWQQSDVNARAAGIVSDLVYWHELDGIRLRALEDRIAALESRLIQIEDEGKP